MPADPGPPDLTHPIPRYHFARAAEESARHFLDRVALAVSFAYRVDLDFSLADPDFAFESASLLLPDGVVAWSRVRGRLRLVRDAALVAETGTDQLFLYFMRSGQLEFAPSRNGRTAGPGDIIVADLAQPSLLSISGYALTSVVIGRALLPPAVQARELHGACIPAEHPLAPIATAMIEGISDGSTRLTPHQATAVLRHAADLVGLALADVVARPRADVPVKAAAEAFIERHLADRDLSPAMIAERLGISRATLYRAFSRRGGVRERIAARRLERAWTLAVSDSGPSADAIAAACGYASAARLDASLMEAFGAGHCAIRKAEGERRVAFAARATELINASWRRRIDVP